MKKTYTEEQVQPLLVGLQEIARCADAYGLRAKAVLKAWGAAQAPAEGEAFSADQWWYQELDAVAKSDDQRRAMAVVRNLMRQLEAARSNVQPKAAEHTQHCASRGGTGAECDCEALIDQGGHQ